MAQIAQQDHLYIEGETLGTFSEADGLELIKKFKAGTILDVVQRTANGVSKCVAASFADEGTTRTYTFVFGGESLVTVTATEEIEA